MNAAIQSEPAFIPPDTTVAVGCGFPKSDYVFTYEAPAGEGQAQRSLAYVKNYFGADPRVRIGRSGQSYAIPVSAQIDRLRASASAFMQHAFENAEEDFLLTSVGTGSLNDEALAQIFAEATANVFLPRRWAHILGDAKGFNLTILGSPGASDDASARLDRLLADKDPSQVRLITPAIPDINMQSYASARGMSLLSRGRTEGAHHAVSLQESMWAADAVLVCGDIDPQDYVRLLNGARRNGLPIRKL